MKNALMIKIADIVNRIIPQSLKSPPPKADNYKEVVDFLIKYQKIQIRYNNIVFGIGIIGLVISAIFFCILYNDHGSKVFTQKEFFPSAIWSIFVSAFNGIELESRKTKLLELINKKLSDGTQEDALELIKNMKDLSWEEFKNLYK